MHTKGVEGEQSSISAHGRKQERVENFRQVAIINVVCKLFMMLLREIINGWLEESGMLGDIQGGFRMGQRTEDNLFMLERMMVTVR